MTTPTVSAKKRFLFYALMLAVAIILLVGAGVLSVWLPYHREQPAIAAIEAVGGEIETEYSGPRWLREWFDEELLFFYQRVNLVQLVDSSIDGALLKKIGGLTKLRLLFLGGSHFINAELEHLNGLANLRLLTFDNSQITDAGLEHLSGLTSLEILFLNNTRVTDAGLVHLTGLTSLEDLSLGDTRVTKEGVDKLRKALPRCGISFF